ncbi:MAG TPA: antibiotic biosynthesis monooxygenase family protein [Acidimicrobiales bacterium]|nr:antibiotic biosynthesis monooxygenase family protein [Acidimicrobiales bacterium]
MADEVELTVVTLAFDAPQDGLERLLAALAKYVVLARGHDGCRNIDLVASVTRHGRLLVIEKWDSPAAQRAHFDSPDMVELAQTCAELLSDPPVVELWEGLSAHDLA